MATDAEIVEFVAEWTGCPIAKIDPDDLFGSTRIDGDDVLEFLDDYGDRYGVRMDGYVWYFHADEEGWALRSPVIIGKDGTRLDRIPITSRMLADYSATGVWGLEYPPHTMKRQIDGRRGTWLAISALIGAGSALILGGC